MTRLLAATLTILAAASSALANPIGGSRQLVVVLSEGWDAQTGKLYRIEQRGPSAGFSQVGPPLAVWLGRSGLAWRTDPGAPTAPTPGPQKREGDGRSPAGLLTLDEMWGYDSQAPAGVQLAYQKATELDRCVDDVDSPLYNQLVKQTAPSPWRSAEQLRMPSDHYKYLVLIGYNRGTSRPGAGSCIFLHVAPSPQGPTAGCTALAETDLLTLLRWLLPVHKPLLLQVPRQALHAVVAAWHLPPELLRLGPKPAPTVRPKATVR